MMTCDHRLCSDVSSWNDFFPSCIVTLYHYAGGKRIYLQTRGVLYDNVGRKQKLFLPRLNCIVNSSINLAVQMQLDIHFFLHSDVEREKKSFETEYSTIWTK